MITQLEVFTSGITTPPFPVGDGSPATDPIQIRRIDGLQPVKTSVNTTQYGSVDGEFYNGSVSGKRNIILTIGLNPNWVDQSFESLRMILYGYFMPQTEITLRFTSTHMPPVQILGVVESFDPDLFARDGEIPISIICPQPYFEAVDAMVIPGETDVLAGSGEIAIAYEGNVDTGMTVDISMPSGGSPVTGEVRLVNRAKNTRILIVTAATVDSTQFVRISTVNGDKFVREYPLPSGIPSSLMNVISPGSFWMPLQKKSTNRVQVLTQTAGLIFTIQYYARYGGL